MSEDLVAAFDTAPSPPEGALGKRAPGRAGRDLPAAIGVGLGLAGLVLATLYSPWRWTFVVVVVAAVSLGVYEVVHALRRLGARPPMVPLVLGGVGMVSLAYAGGADAQPRPCEQQYRAGDDGTEQRDRHLVSGLEDDAG